MDSVPVFTRDFTDDTGPVADGMARKLLALAERVGNSADLRHTLVLVPTRTAARRLRTALVAHAESLDFAGVFTPKIVTPDAALHLFHRTGTPVAPPDAARLVLARLLGELAAGDFSAIFPDAGVLATPRGREQAAEAILKARTALGDAEGAPDFAAVAAHPDNEEPDRWRDLARIESLYREKLAALGYADANDTRAAALRSPRLPESLRLIVLAALPDPSPSLVAWLRAAGRPVLALVAADPADAGDFDALGAPIPERLRDRPPAWSDFDAQVHTPETPAAMQAGLAALWSARRPHGGKDAVILADAALTRALEQAVADTGGLTHRAEGTPFAEHPLVLVLREWAEFLQGEDSWECLGRLLRRPAFARAIAPDTPHATILRDWDTADEAHLPQSPEQLEVAAATDKAVVATRARLAAVRRLKTAFEGAPDLPRALDHLLAQPGLQSDDPAERALRDTLAEEAAALADLATRLGDLPNSRLLAMLVRRLESAAEHAVSPAESVALRGWLELLWEDAPCVVLAGLNEGRVPESLTADAFLPGSLRDKLGLPGDDRRFARDAYALDRALRMRRAAGRVEVYAPRHDNRGEPLRPSRLLSAGAGDALPARVLRLYAESGEAPAEPARTEPWKLLPRVDAARLAEVETKLSPTALRDYLACPFRFYLSRVLRAEPVEPGRAEPDALAFGNLVHEALRAYGTDPATADLAEPEKVRAALLRLLDEAASRAFGSKPSVGGTVQIHAARARLSAFAEAQAARRAEGWRIRHCEHPFTLTLRFDDGAPDFTLAGKIDRLDHHESENRWCVVDYKTSARGETPDRTHLAPVRDTSAYPDFHITANAGENDARWIDLQLPLYVEAALACGLTEGARATPAYGLLPEAASKSAFAEWENYTGALHEDALKTTRAIVRAIRERRFEPAAKPPAFDPYANLLGLAPIDLAEFRRQLAAR